MKTPRIAPHSPSSRRLEAVKINGWQSLRRLGKVIHTAVFAMSFAIIGTAQTAPTKHSAEKWVTTQIAAGQMADLRSQFPKEANRVLSAKFLEELLMCTLPNLKPRRIGIQIKGAIFKEPIDLANATIPCEVWLEQCRFEQKANFEGASFARNLSFEESTFLADANFNSLKVQGLFLYKTIFEGAVNFGAADIGTIFAAQELKCNKTDRAASFNSMKVGRSAFLTRARFEGPVDFVKANINLSFEAAEAQFCNQEHDADFNGLKVGDDALLRQTVFEGPVDFASADIGGKLLADQTQFNNSGRGATFNGMKVEGAFFSKAVFEGPVNFVAADIAINFEAQNVEFRSRTDIAWLTVKCGKSGIFNGATFQGPVSFADSTFLDLIIQDINPVVVVPELDLARISVKRRLQVKKVTVEKLDARSVRVEGPAYFTNITVKSSASLAHGNFATLDLSGSVWPKEAGAFSLQGTKYDYVRAALRERDSRDALLKLADQSAYNADVYGNLEQFLIRQGYRGEADGVFVAGKRRERQETPYGFRRFASWCLDWLVGYGRRPWQAGLPCIALVGFGWLIFAPKKMEMQKPEAGVRSSGEQGPPGYSRFWYSLGLFLPFVDLESNTVWKPKLSEKILNYYMRVHILLGWILIPILLAALTGLIK